MGLKVCPRTGMIKRGPVRPSKFPPSPHMYRHKKTDNMFPTRPLHSGQVSEPQFLRAVQALTPEQLQQLAVEIGKTIADQIADGVQVQVNPAVHLQAYSAGQPQANRVNVDTTKKHVDIKIDESIADVGIGKQAPLEKGKGSANIVEEEIVQDNISKSKQALKALKSG